jgi:excisionase family DNA binding protein
LGVASPAGDAPNWLTLGAASQLLGVSESTIRRWADAGEVRSFRTRGGHRRILEGDLRAMLAATASSAPRGDTSRISAIAMARVRRRLSRGRQTHAMDVFQGLDADALERLRLLGRQLVDLFAAYISQPGKRPRFGEDARAIGREYGRTLVGAGVGLTTAIVTFNSLRRSLEETASQIASEAGLGTDEAVVAIEDILGLADTVLEGMAQVYERAARMAEGRPAGT